MMSSRQRTGFTLVEVMAAGVILAVATAGLFNLWTLASAQTRDLTLRQKAVFALNSEMERLGALYTNTAFAVDVALDTDGYTAAAGISDERAIYRSGMEGLPSDTSSGIIGNATLFFLQDGAVVLVDESGSTNEGRNYVWIEKTTQIAAQISWVEQEITIDQCDANGAYSTTQTQPCYCAAWDGSDNDARCREITLVLEYPYRLTQTGAVSVAGPLEVMTLRTVVGRL